MNAQRIFRNWLSLGLALNLLLGGVQTWFGPAWLWLVLMPRAGWLPLSVSSHRPSAQAVRVRRKQPSQLLTTLDGAPGSEKA